MVLKIYSGQDLIWLQSYLCVKMDVSDEALNPIIGV